MKLEFLQTNKRLVYSTQEFLEDKTINDYNVENDPVLTFEKYDLKNAMQIFVQNIYNKTFAIDVYPYETIYNVKEKVESIEGTPPDKQRLVISRKLLHDEHKISYYNIGNQSTITILYRLLGRMLIY